MQKMGKALTIILIIFLPLYFLLLSVEVNTFNQDFYLNSYKEYDVLNTTGKNIEELDIITVGLLSYLKEDSTDEEILSPHFNEREIKHLEDVKFLFKYGFIIKNILLILSVLSIVWFLIYGRGKGIGRSVFYGSFIWWGLILLLFLVSTLDFNKYFTYFHLIFFNNDLWILNPETDLLIQMLPLAFFISIFKRILLGFILFLGIIQVLSFILMKREGELAKNS